MLYTQKVLDSNPSGTMMLSRFVYKYHIYVALDKGDFQMSKCLCPLQDFHIPTLTFHLISC